MKVSVNDIYHKINVEFQTDSYDYEEHAETTDVTMENLIYMQNELDELDNFSQFLESVSNVRYTENNAQELEKMITEYKDAKKEQNSLELELIKCYKAGKDTCNLKDEILHNKSLVEDLFDSLLSYGYNPDIYLH